MTDITHHADDATLAHIASLESQLLAAQKRLTELADSIANGYHQTPGEILDEVRCVIAELDQPTKGAT